MESQKLRAARMLFSDLRTTQPSLHAFGIDRVPKSIDHACVLLTHMP
jgi:hypothetical protein